MSAREHRIYHRLQLAAHSLRKHADRQVAAIADLTTTQGAVLSVLVNGEGRTQKEVAARLGLNESAMTPMVARLTRLGYVQRKKSTSDRRAWCLTPTPKGRAVLNDIKVPFDRLNQMIDGELSRAQVKALAKALDTLIAAVSAELPIKEAT